MGNEQLSQSVPGEVSQHHQVVGSFLGSFARIIPMATIAHNLATAKYADQPN